jgi:hypothetical protein
MVQYNPLPSESLETEFFLESDETPVDINQDKLFIFVVVLK